ncbi:FecR domain-containing protein [Caulobacter sp.]|uniref:FecR family protein n=1 Tax=Caulobacter sp. TaxID=78 RepID=UPI001B0041CD|nr:FecR domain-containing protein [Caulobacter sp.]MBO9544468.1 FecR domain-containing protein [Caulobacter sp.]
MTLPETADAINRDAADWAARADRGLTETEAAELATWLAGDPRRLGGYMRMTAVLAATEVEGAADEVSRTSRQAMAGPTRRWWIAGAAAAASIAGVGIYLGLARSRVYETRKGETRVLALEDGSIVTLNTATRLEVRYSRNLRHVHLVSGEALFDVAKNRARPFVVQASNVDVRAVGTSFTVAATASRTVKVLVREGVVEVARPSISTAAPMRMKANTRALIGDATAPMTFIQVSAVEVSRELAWREGRLVFAGESLSTAAAEFARYSDTRIVVQDPTLSASGVAGVFDANDPVGFARAVAGSLESRAEVREGYVVITR